MLKFEYMRFIFQRAKQTEIVRAIAFTIILFIILGQIAVRFNLVRAIGLYSAQGVIGQLEYSTITEYSPDLSESSFGANNNSVTANALGFNFPGEIAVDYTNNRMFVADTGNSRVLVFNLNSENQIIDYEADYVLGQVDFLNNDTETTIINLNAPTYLAIDQDNQLLYVSDTGNNRIMILILKMFQMANLR